MAASSEARQTFFELLQVAIGNREKLSRTPSEKEWREVYQMAVKQSVVGLLFSAIEKLNASDASLKPGVSVFYQWLGEVAQIEAQNKRMNEAAVQLTRIFKEKGLRTCVLKGQGLARLYPDPLRRQSGDIDLWVEGEREKTLRFLKENCPGIGQVVIHHVNAQIIDGVETEVHFLPIWLYNPWYNRRLQKWFRSHQDQQFSNYDNEVGFCYPKVEFNVVYCLVHVYNHLLNEGVGMRQIVDYFYLLRSEDKLTIGKGQLTILLRHLGLDKIAGAMMWVIAFLVHGEGCTVNGFKRDDWMIFEPDERRGRALLAEIMATGNMGHYDTRFKKGAAESAIGRNLRKSCRWLNLVKYYPSEVVCMPVWKLWHWTWRLWKGYR